MSMDQNHLPINIINLYLLNFLNLNLFLYIWLNLSVYLLDLFLFMDSNIMSISLFYDLKIHWLIVVINDHQQ